MLVRYELYKLYDARKINLNRELKMIEHLPKKEKVYEIKVGNLNVEMIYSSSNKKMDECMLSILKHKHVTI